MCIRDRDINLVINYDVPNDAEDYVHRIGRTARADTTGVALTLINPDDMYKFSKIEELIEMEVMKIPLPEFLGDGPEWNTKSRGRGRGRGGYKSGRGKSRNNNNSNRRKQSSRR